MAIVEIDVAGDSDIGLTRQENQDHFLIADLRRQLSVRETNLPDSEKNELHSGCEGHLFIVADGMGGHLGGEQASRTALKSISRYVLDMMHWFLKLRPNDEQDFLDELSDSLRVGQERLWSECDKRNRGMGTTLTMSYLIWPKMYVVHAGDSRCYLQRGGKLQQLTTDHTLAQQLLDQGAITSEEAARSKWRHVLWNCVGGQDEPVRPEALRCRLEVGDTLLLCTDGLTGMVSDDMIASIMQRSPSSSVAVGNLIDAAKAAGGSDNISVIVCRFIEAISSDCETSFDNPSDGDDTTKID